MADNPIFMFFLGVFATYRVAHYIANEGGFADSSDKFQAWLWKVFKDKDGMNHWIPKLARCVMCLSLIFSIPFVLILRPTTWEIGIMYWLAMSGLNVFIHEILYARS